ncbi:MAG: hypothetical protein IJN53_05215 [Oscillospiraceae bacterium]|nr:hypothetical protein [Oscillospiraceae bacterium]
MDALKEQLLALNITGDHFWKAVVLLAVGSLVLGCIGRYCFGKNSIIDHSVSSAIGILFIYAATVVLFSLGAKYERFVATLPFIRLSGDTMHIFVFEGTEFTLICEQLVNMIILAFLANVLDSILPRGENFFTWLIFRCLTIILAIAMQLGVNWLFTAYLPQGIVTYAPTILLIVLVLMLAVGIFKIFVGAAIATVNPIVGALYTFFFATYIGRSISKAVLTTIILSFLVLGLNSLGITAIGIALAGLVAYIPLMVALLIVWYIVNRIL